MTPDRSPVPRATRFPLNLPLRYRTEGTDDWSYGMTLNVSHTGVLFEGDREVDMRAGLVIELVLPGDPEATVTLTSRAAPARTPTDGERSRKTLAVTLAAGELARSPR